MNIYFVCTGNTCRSPMAEAILKAKQLSNVAVKSAGIYAANGNAMSTNAQLVLAEENIAHQHVSKQLTQEEVSWADVILTMTKAHKQMIVQTFEGAQYKTYTLKEYASAEGDVSDPFGGTLQTYRATFDQLKQLIEQLTFKEGENR